MIGLKVPFREAEKVKQYLVDNNLLDKSFSVLHQADGIVFPVVREFGPPWDFDVEFVREEAQERLVPCSWKEAIEPLLSNEEKEHLRTAFDQVGSIAIIEIMPELESKQKVLAEKLLEMNPSIKTVLKKAGGRSGTFRLQPLEFLAGEDTRIATVIENGIKLRVNVEDAYYSVRMATERKRIAEMIKPGEDILCLFSGVGPYPITFSVHTSADRIVGVEINPQAHQLALENIGKNRCTNVRLLRGDAKDIVPKLHDEKFDRITMPLPESAMDFIELVLSVTKKGGTIHCYTFEQEGEFDRAISTLRRVVEKKNRRLLSYEVIKAGQHAPRVWRICIDAVIG